MATRVVPRRKKRPTCTESEGNVFVPGFNGLNWSGPNFGATWWGLCTPLRHGSKIGSVDRLSWKPTTSNSSWGMGGGVPGWDPKGRESMRRTKEKIFLHSASRLGSIRAVARSLNGPKVDGLPSSRFQAWCRLTGHKTGVEDMGDVTVRMWSTWAFISSRYTHHS